MAKVNISKPTGTIESLNLVSAFNVEGNTYVVLDSEKSGSMGLPIIYVSKFINGKLEKINDTNEWQSVKNYLKGIINGTSFQYVKVDESLNADEAYYMPLTLPQASFDIIKSRYVIKDDNNSGAEAEVLDVKDSEVPNNLVTEQIASAPAETTQTPMSDSPVVAQTTEAVPSAISLGTTNLTQESPVVPNVAPVMPDNNVVSNVNNVSTQLEEAKTVEVVPVEDTVAVSTDSQVVSSNPQVEVAKETININSFDSDKETFLKACENMFDALISKYQKQLADVERREQELVIKEKEVVEKLKNAEAKEQVANIAHDNAQKVMNLENFMPVNPDTNNNPTGVI